MLVATISYTKPTNPENLNYDRLAFFSTRSALDSFIANNPNLYVLDINTVLELDPST